jgi:hypothetical protein
MRRYACFSADKILFTLEDGYGLTLELLQDHAFNTPILVNKKDGLNLKVPPPNFSIQDVENKVGKSGCLLMLKPETCSLAYALQPQLSTPYLHLA